ncbi:transglutaminase family protein [Jatrophihabitans sp.]|uniref:transglutaminase-like domain-containing protein n=1 Tax=Jatrophihabitans sp. TaxID=1932789 RepID=UPI0030C65B61|nr:transglutaminase domain protein [Jatrophihabitans sp.]
MTPNVRRFLSASLVLHVYDQPRVILQLAASGFAPDQLDETLTVTCDGEPLEITEVTTEAQTRVHLFTARPGQVMIDYRATVEGRGALLVPTAADAIVYLRPSRYAESDRLAAFAQNTFGDVVGTRARIAAVVAWTNSHLDYVIGSSRPIDGAVDTMLSRQGVCRDFAHLVIALLRSLDIPARLAAVYAPGLSPMDFHAVAEVIVDGAWIIVDATGLAPRSSMLRIATGRDAADTAFASVYGGAVDFWETTVSAVIDGYLPLDDPDGTFSLT